jgi:hypothetical protein
MAATCRTATGPRTTPTSTKTPTPNVPSLLADEGLFAVFDAQALRQAETDPMELIALDADAEVVWSSALGRVDPWWDCCPVRVDHEEGVIIVEDPVRLLHHDPATGELLDAEVTGRAEDVTDRNPGLGNPSVWYPHEDVEVVASDGGHRLDVRTPDGAVTIRSDRTIRVESIDPLVVADEREVLGVRVPTEGE